MKSKGMLIKKTIIAAAAASLINAGGLFGTQEHMYADQSANVENSVTVSSPDKSEKPSAIRFLDIEGHWAKDAIETAIKKGYVDGYEDQTFRPDRQLTRAEFVKMVMTALKIPVMAQASGGSWYSPYVNAAVNNHIHVASDFSTGDWNTPISRIEMARLAVRAAVKTYQQPGKMAIPDNQVMYLATKAGLIQGMDDTGSLGEDQPTTRAQSVTIIERILTVAAGGKLPADKHAVSRAEVKWHGTNIFTMLPRYFPADQMNKFDLSVFHWDSSDGNYHEKVLEYIAVDMEDPNDPFRREIEDIPVRYWKQDDPNAVYFDKLPQKSYVTFSKVEIKLDGPYPDSLSRESLVGGGINIEPIVPADGVITVPNNKYDSYDKLNTPQQVFRTIHITGMPVYKWIKNKFNLPGPVTEIPGDGGKFYWIAAEVQPKGDFFSATKDSISLSYTPNLSYYINFGPYFNGTNASSLSTMFIPDYTQHN